MKTKAQSIIEYSIIIAMVTSAFLVMQVYLHRAVQSGLKPLDEQLSPRPEKFVNNNNE
jgi:hypothetical protein